MRNVHLTILKVAAFTTDLVARDYLTFLLPWKAAATTCARACGQLRRDLLEIPMSLYPFARLLLFLFCELVTALSK